MSKTKRCCVIHSACMVSYGDLFFLRYVLQFQTETDSAPLVVRTPSAACKPWMSSGLVSIRTRITLSPSLVRRTASSAEKTTSETYKTCPTRAIRSRSTTKVQVPNQCHVKKYEEFRNDGNTDVKSSINRLHSITSVPFVQLDPRTLHVNICQHLPSNLPISINAHSKTTLNKWTTSEKWVGHAPILEAKKPCRQPRQEKQEAP